MLKTILNKVLLCHHHAPKGKQASYQTKTSHKGDHKRLRIFPSGGPQLAPEQSLDIVVYSTTWLPHIHAFKNKEESYTA